MMPSNCSLFFKWHTYFRTTQFKKIPAGIAVVRCLKTESQISTQCTKVRGVGGCHEGGAIKKHASKVMKRSFRAASAQSTWAPGKGCAEAQIEELLRQNGWSKRSFVVARGAAVRNSEAEIGNEQQQQEERERKSLCQPKGRGTTQQEVSNVMLQAFPWGRYTWMRRSMSAKRQQARQPWGGAGLVMRGAIWRPCQLRECSPNLSDGTLSMLVLQGQVCLADPAS
eukprot:scaffold231578_cov13-Tisochrysis_lutea.AAC.1